jgi:hypothetical protein
MEPKQKKEVNDKEELENLADIIEQAMFQDYKLAYSEEAIQIKKKHNRLLLLVDDYIKRCIFSFCHLETHLNFQLHIPPNPL